MSNLFDFSLDETDHPYHEGSWISSLTGVLIEHGEGSGLEGKKKATISVTKVLREQGSNVLDTSSIF